MSNTLQMWQTRGDCPRCGTTSSVIWIKLFHKRHIMLLCSRDPGYIRDDLKISTKPDRCIFVVRLTSRLTSCTSQSRTRKLSESSPSSSTCSLSGALLEFLPPSLYSVQQKCLKYFASKQLWNHDIWPVFAQSSLGAILLSLYYVFLWKNPHTQAALQKAKVITMLNADAEIESRTILAVLLSFF